MMSYFVTQLAKIKGRVNSAVIFPCFVVFSASLCVWRPEICYRSQNRDQNRKGYKNNTMASGVTWGRGRKIILEKKTDYECYRTIIMIDTRENKNYSKSR